MLANIEHIAGQFFIHIRESQNLASKQLTQTAEELAGLIIFQVRSQRMAHTTFPRMLQDTFTQLKQASKKIEKSCHQSTLTKTPVTASPCQLIAQRIYSPWLKEVAQQQADQIFTFLANNTYRITGFREDTDPKDKALQCQIYNNLRTIQTVARLAQERLSQTSPHFPFRHLDKRYKKSRDLISKSNTRRGPIIHTFRCTKANSRASNNTHERTHRYEHWSDRRTHTVLQDIPEARNQYRTIIPKAQDERILSDFKNSFVAEWESLQKASQAYIDCLEKKASQLIDLDATSEISTVTPSTSLESSTPSSTQESQSPLNHNTPASNHSTVIQDFYQSVTHCCV